MGRVAQSGLSHVASDVEIDPYFFDSLELPATRSELAVPLRVGEEVMGVLDVQSTTPDAFTEADVAILQTMADQLSLALENARLLEGTRQRLREVSLLLGERVRTGWIRLSDASPDWGYVYDGVDVRPSAQVQTVKVSSAQIEMPVEVRRGEMIGRLRVSLGEEEPSEEQVTLVRAVAQQLGVALENARLFAEAQTTLEELEVLNEAGQAIGAAHNAAEILQAFVDYAVEPEGVDRALLLVREELGHGAEGLIVAGWRAGGGGAVLESPRLLRDFPFLGDRTPEPIIVSDVRAHPELNLTARPVLMDGMELGAVAVIPLQSAGRLLGWVILGVTERTYPFGEREVRLYRTLADPAAVALENVRLIQATRRRVEQERALSEIVARIRASSDPEVILRTAVREAGRALQATEATILLGEQSREGEET